MISISGIQYISHDTPFLTHAQQAQKVIEGGISWVQFRSKEKSGKEKELAAKELLEVCKTLGASCIINDDVLLAKELKADGVHLGKHDMQPEEARQILGEDFIIGGTANTIEDIRNLTRAGVNYIGCGPFRFTTTKKNLSPILGINGYKEIISQCRDEGNLIPIVGIGGILFDDLKELANTGLNGIALSSVILNADDIPAMSRKFVEGLSQFNR